MSKFLTGVAAGAILCAWAGAVFATDLPGKFDGVTIDAKLIGGQQYEALYARIAEWEKATGAKVNVISKKNHFELDKEIKSDIATGNNSWCVGSNHSSFAPQYPDIYTDLSALLPKEEIDAFVPANIKASTLDGKLVMLPIDTSETVGPVGLTMRTDTVSSGALQMLIQILRDVSGASLSRSATSRLQ